MEQLMDVSWMTHGKDKLSKHNNTKWSTHDSPQSAQSAEPTTPTKANGKPASGPPSPSPQPSTTSTAAKPIPPRPSLAPKSSTDEKKSPGPNGTPPGRRGSWFARIQQAVSTSPAASPSQNAESDEATPLPKISPSKNAVLPHATRQTGEHPYVPAPPRSAQPGFLHVFRRLSSTGGNTSTTKNNHGLVDRKVLNVDKRRERPRLNELNQAKLRRVAFCVDVEIAPMPKYADTENAGDKPGNKAQRQKSCEKSEGDALKRSKAGEEHREAERAEKAEEPQNVPEPEHEPEPEVGHKEAGDEKAKENGTEPAGEDSKPEKETSRKKEKKKKSEAERKAKKEQKRKEALEKGAIPMELHYDSDSSIEGTSAPRETPKFVGAPTTNPARIYRRCCQLRETDILTKITLQLPKAGDGCVDGAVEKLDLTGYFMSLPDLVTLGDFLAVVPVKEVILEDCGLMDEGVRVVLAGLLASKRRGTKQRKSVTKPADLVQQGGVVERLVLKNNKLGLDGWKHICLFIHMCRSIKCLDLSNIPFPPPSETAAKTPLSHLHLHHGPSSVTQLDLSLLLSKSLGERLAGPELELLNLGNTGIKTNQLGAVIDGALKSGLCRLGLASNDLDTKGVQHVAKYLQGGKCQGLDLGGNDLREQLEIISDAINEDATLWALSLANCNLKSGSLCKLFSKLSHLHDFKFIDLSHNHDICESEPSAIGILRRYLPKLDALRRLHLADVSMSSEQAIALAEIIPEIKTLAHINLLENPKMITLADAQSEEAREESCALYASLLAAARVSKSLVKVDINTPSAESGELVRALANQLLAYCLRNMQTGPDLQEAVLGGPPLDFKYPDVLRHIVGHEEDLPVVDEEEDTDAAPDEDYVVGGTGIVKALTCCLKNSGEETGRQSGEFVRDFETGTVAPRASMPPGKAKDMSKHLLANARKIRLRLQPTLAKAKAYSNEDVSNFHRLLFLDQTLQGIIKRFEDEFPETREAPMPEAAQPPALPALHPRGNSFSSGEVDQVFHSDTEELETEIRSPSHSRSNSIVSTSKALAEEEGRALRVGHQFRRGFLREEHYSLFTNSEENLTDPDHLYMLQNLLEDLAHDNEDIRKKVDDKGPERVFLEDKDEIVRTLREKDPVLWDRFIESQEKARANMKPDEMVSSSKDGAAAAAAAGTDKLMADESAIDD